MSRKNPKNYKVLYNKKCVDCGVLISAYYSIRCKACDAKLKRGKNSPHWKGGFSKCVDCGKQLSTYGKNRCISCALKRKPKRYGPDHNTWKGGKPKCEVCGKQLNHYYTRKCFECYVKILGGSTHHCWQGGISNKPGKCIDCGIEIGTYDTIRCKKCHAISTRGSNNWNWKGEISPLRKCIRSLEQATQWKKEVLQRDNYTCQECGLKSEAGNFNLMIAHHKKQFSNILQEFLQQYDQFSPIEDKETLVRLAIKYEPFWDIDNGETYCEKCHKLIKMNYSNRRTYKCVH